MIKRILSLLFLVCVLSNCKNTKKDPNTFEAVLIKENVYSIVSPSFGLPTPENKGWNSNSHFVLTTKGVLLFDSGSSEAIGNKIMKTIKTVTDLPVLWVVNSHSHADHWLGNAAFKDAEIITSTQALSTMKKYGKEDVQFFSKITKGTIGKTNLVYPTKLISKEEKVVFGNTEIEFMFSNNAHSKGDLLMWLPKQKIIFGGDVLSSDWMPIITNPKNLPELINTLKKVASLQPNIVLTGHGKATNKTAIQRDLDLLTNVMRIVEEEYKKGKKAAEILPVVKSNLATKFLSKYKNFDSEIKRYVAQLFQLHQKSDQKI